MAYMVGTPGQTAEHVEIDKLLLVDRARVVGLCALGAGSAAFAWAAGWGAVPALLSASLVAVAAGTAWLFVTATPLGPVLGKAIDRHMPIQAVAASADIVLGAGGGTVAGAFLTVSADTAHRLAWGAAGLLAAAAAGWWRFHRDQASLGRLLAGWAGETRVAHELSRLPDDYIIMTDLTLADPQGGVCEADHLVLGPTGVYVIEVKRWSGRITPGAHTADPWIQENRRGRFPRPSPLAQFERTQRAVAGRLEIPTSAVVPVLVLVGGRLSGPVSVTTVSPGALRERLVTRPPQWPLARSPVEAAQLFLPAP